MNKPKIDCAQHFPTLEVSNVAEAIEYYTQKLGFNVGFQWGDPVSFAAVTLGQVEIHLGEGKSHSQGASVSFLLDDADELYQFHCANGVEIIRPIENQPWGLREYTISDKYGYHLRFGHHYQSASPPLKIERVDVPVRLEKRLAALLQDLAEHKQMSLDSCLEEILLHTCEQLGDGVASPHTKRTLEHIQELKKKHGIDYDSHASYRFVE